MVVRRDVYERLGRFDTRIRRSGEDWEMWVRGAAHYPLWYEPEPLAIYRVGDGTLISEAMRTGENVRDLVRVIELMQPLLPEHQAGELRPRALETAALTAGTAHAAARWLLHVLARRSRAAERREICSALLRATRTMARMEPSC
jgi:hypothetical protein